MAHYIASVPENMRRLEKRRGHCPLVDDVFEGRTTFGGYIDETFPMFSSPKYRDVLFRRPEIRPDHEERVDRILGSLREIDMRYPSDSTTYGPLEFVETFEHEGAIAENTYSLQIPSFQKVQRILGGRINVNDFSPEAMEMAISYGRREHTGKTRFYLAAGAASVPFYFLDKFDLLTVGCLMVGMLGTTLLQISISSKYAPFEGLQELAYRTDNFVETFRDDFRC